jgi:hypothetical protein
MEFVAVLVKKFPLSCGKQKFLTLFANASFSRDPYHLATVLLINLNN